MKTPSLANLVKWTVATALTLLAASPAAAANRMYLGTTAPGASTASGTIVCSEAEALYICEEDSGLKTLSLSPATATYLERKQAAGAHFTIGVTVQLTTIVGGFTGAAADGTLIIADQYGTIAEETFSAVTVSATLNPTYSLPNNVDLATLTVTWESSISICCYRTTTFDQAAAGSYLNGYPSISW